MKFKIFLIVFYLFVCVTTNYYFDSVFYGEKIKSFDQTFNVDCGRSLGGGYDIDVHAEDQNGNVAKYKTHMDGLAEAIVNCILDFLTKLAEAIAALASMFIDWIWNAIEGMMNTVFKPIKDGIKSYVKSVASSLEKYVDGSGDAESVMDALFGPFASVMKVLIDVGKAVMNIVKPFFDLVNDLLDSVVTFVKDVMAMAFGGNKNEKHSAEKDVKNNSDNSDFLLVLIKNMLGVSADSESKGEWSGLEKINIILAVLSLWSTLVIAAIAAGMGNAAAALFSLIAGCGAIFFALYSDINPIILSLISIGFSFAGLMATHIGYLSAFGITGWKPLDTFFLAWSSLCVAISCSVSIYNLKEHGMLG